MLTPRENRFAKLVIERGLLTQEQIDTLAGPDTEQRREGATLMLWDSAVLKKMLDAAVGAKLMDEVGDLDVEKLGKFTLVKHLGRGGMGSVWLGVGPDHEKVAVKVLHPSFANERTFLTRFFREAQTSVKLKHDHIVRGIEVGESDGNYYFAMEFVEGRSIESILQKEGRIPTERAVQIILEVADALAYAHENGMIHRDIKPDNVMLTADGHAKLADLGLARLTQEGATRLTESGTTMGTPAYMPPEQCTAARQADARSDIYSLGATWYHMVVGEPPFTGNSALEVMQKQQKDALKWPPDAHTRLPKGVIVTIERMMAKAPQNRIQTTRELITVIKSQCLGQRDVFAELGVKKEAAESKVWHIQVPKDGETKTYQLREDKLREMIRLGKLTPEVAVRPGDGRGPFVPIGSIKGFAGMFPTPTQPARPAGKAAGRSKPADTLEGMKPAPRQTVAAAPKDAYRELVTNYDAHDRKYRRKKAFKTAVSVIVKTIVLAAVVGGFLFCVKYGIQYYKAHEQPAEKSAAPDAGPAGGTPSN